MTLWLALHGLDGPTHTRARATLIQTRETLRAFLADQLETDARESVNAILRRGAERPVFAGKALVTEIEGSPGWRAPWRAARDLIALHAEYPGRIRSCANPDCPLYFLDTSRPGTRRWCSMSVCGNRDKTRRHYQRHH
jgi:predicted RNA-binding Zn ribbon-like protein